MRTGTLIVAATPLCPWLWPPRPSLRFLAEGNTISGKAPPPVDAASSSIPVADGERVQLFKTMWDRKRKFYRVPVQKTGAGRKLMNGRRGLEFCLFALCAWHHQHPCMSRWNPRSLSDLQQATDQP